MLFEFYRDFKIFQKEDKFTTLNRKQEIITNRLNIGRVKFTYSYLIRNTNNY